MIRGEMTFFHEIGHSMNANHDDDNEFKNRNKECNPTDEEGGSYLMYSTSTEGLLPNNRAYSHCSLDTISWELICSSGFLFNLCDLLENIREHLANENQIVYQQIKKSKENVMVSCQQMKFVMNKEQQVIAAQKIVN